MFTDLLCDPSETFQLAIKEIRMGDGEGGLKRLVTLSSAPMHYPPAMYEVANALLKGLFVPKNPQKAIELFERAAELGHRQSQYNLGVLYRDGTGTSRDFTKAVFWFRKAADAGDVNALNALGMRYRDGQGVKQDFTQAAQLFKRASAAGNPDALFNLGILQVRGLGIPKDEEAGIASIEKSASLGNVAAQRLLNGERDF